VIINLTQHQASPAQVSAGVADYTEIDRLKSLLNFFGVPTQREIEERAQAIALLALETGASSAMIGGAPYLMSALERALNGVGVKPLYAFTQRITTEKGGVKTSTFAHLGFVEV